MSKNLLIIISGLPCTGKTTLSKKIADKFKLPLINKDSIKESLFDSLGFKDREWSKKIGIASYKTLYQIIELLLQTKQSFIVESNFKPEFDNQKFQNLQNKYKFETLQIICETKGKILLERFQKRSESGERHPGHVDHLNYDEFKKILLSEEYEALDIDSKILNINTTDFNKIDYDSIFKIIKSKLK
ncbi:ATP-binding protein [bacterium]|nr:ATP-binding protein [bacterium]